MRHRTDVYSIRTTSIFGSVIHDPLLPFRQQRNILYMQNLNPSSTFTITVSHFYSTNQLLFMFMCFRSYNHSLNFTSSIAVSDFHSLLSSSLHTTTKSDHLIDMHFRDYFHSLNFTSLIAVSPFHFHLDILPNIHDTMHLLDMSFLSRNASHKLLLPMNSRACTCIIPPHSL